MIINCFYIFVKQRKFQIETEVENWIQKYDQDMGERQVSKIQYDIQTVNICTYCCYVVYLLCLKYTMYTGDTMSHLSYHCYAHNSTHYLLLL